MSSKGILKSMMVIGGSQAINIVISVLRVKFLAILLGPSGIGLLSIFNNLQSISVQASSLGISSSGVRQLASARQNQVELNNVRRVMMAAHLAQGTIAMVALYLFRLPISEWVFGDPNYTNEVILIGVTALFTLLMAAQTTLLQGLRKVNDLGRVTIIAALFGTVVGLLAVLMFGISGLIWFVIAQPFTGLLVALYFTRSIDKPKTEHPNIKELWLIWKPMVQLGMAFMLGVLATSLTLLVLRGWIVRDFGLEAAGWFAAASGITMTYVGLLLGAMASDFYPRLSEAIDDRVAANTLINDQIQLVLAIGGPILLLLVGLAPWLLQLLYSAEFASASALLQWQLVGNVLKFAGWPLGFALAAAALGKTFLAANINFNVIFLLLLWPTLPTFGIIAAGPSFVLAYFIHLLVLNILAYRLVKFRWQPLSINLLYLHLLLIFALLGISLYAPVTGAIVSLFLSLGTSIYGLRIVLIKIGSVGKFSAKLARAYAIIGLPIWNIK